MPDIKPTPLNPNYKPDFQEDDFTKQGQAEASQRPDLVRVGFGLKSDLDLNIAPEFSVKLLPRLWNIDGLPIQGFVEAAVSGTSSDNARVELRLPISILDPKLFSIDIIPYVSAPFEDLNPDVGVGFGGSMKLYGLLGGFLYVQPSFAGTRSDTVLGGGLSLDF